MSAPTARGNGSAGAGRDGRGPGEDLAVLDFVKLDHHDLRSG
jgi:hypothetical protein